MSTVDDLRKLASRGNRSIAAVDDLNLETLLDELARVQQLIEDLQEAKEEYADNDPKEATTRDEREQLAEQRTDAWDTIQETADELADALEELATW